MTTLVDGHVVTRKGMGLVREVFGQRDLVAMAGRYGVGHTRYPTVGAGTVNDAQPFFTNHPDGVAMAHNGNVTNFASLKTELAQRDHRFVNSECDVELILNVFAAQLAEEEERSDRKYPEGYFRAVASVFERVAGTYSVVGFVVDRGLFAFRDPYGIKPLVFGRREGWTGKGNAPIMFASESAALTASGYRLERDVRAGEAIFVDPDGTLHSRVVGKPDHHPCIFEFIYFARPDSIIDDTSVYHARLRLGEELGRAWVETGRTVDVVIPVPDSSRPAALAMAQHIGVRYREGLLKNRYVNRTFIMPSTENRARSVRRKLSPLKLEIEGKHVLLVDDSIVRGTTSKEIVAMVRRAGAKTVSFASACPPLRYPCVYGIDMSTQGEFIARRHDDIVGIREEIGCDFLLYQTIEGMIRACRWDDRIEHFCMACIDGRYPTGDVTDEVLSRIAAERRACGAV
jgi:amidophosphoribosyltransferase